MSLRWKLFISSLLAGMALLAFLMLVWMPRSLQQAERNYHHEVDRQLQTVATGLVSMILERRLASLHAQLDDLRTANPSWLQLAVADAAGKRLYPLALKPIPAGHATVHHFTQDIRFLDERLGTLELAVDFGPYLQSLKHEQYSLWAWLTGGLALFVMILWVAVDYLVRRPAVILAQAAQRLASNDFEAPLPRSRGDEIGAMINSFAAMRQRLFEIQADLRREVDGHRAARHELHDEKERIQVMLHSIGDGVVVVNEHGRVEYTNPAADELIGRPAEGAYGRPVTEVCTVFKDSYAEPPGIHPVLACLRSGQRIKPSTHLMLACPGHTPIPVEITASPLRDRADRLAGAVMVLRDVTALRTAHLDALHQRDSLLRTVVTSAPIILFTVDLNGQITLAEGQDLSRWGENRPTQIANLAAVLPSIEEDIQRALAGESFHSYLEGRDRVYEVRYSPILDAARRISGATAIATDVTERKHAEQRLNELAYYDTLTGLPNRQLFHDRLGHAMATATRNGNRIAVMFLDLDRFKAINDSMGHETGDALLKAVAQRIGDTLRKEDTLARLGGDEFTIILGDIDGAGDAATVAQKIIDAFSQPFQIHEHELFVSTSIGITTYPDDHLQVDGLLRNADTAMYHAKESGRNTYQFYSAHMTIEAQQRLKLENHLRVALERGELELRYQPQLDCQSGAIWGVEALVRWRHPELGDIRPDQFIPLAEDTGLIHSIGEWVLRTACAQAVAWQREAANAPRISVNLSPRQLKRADFSHQVSEILKATGLAPQSLELELTEGSLVDDPEHALEALEKFKRAGIQLALDDFGTGYSSLSYLNRFPIDTLKIDRSFVNDIGTTMDANAVVSAIVAMASNLRLRVVAEGVEQQDQLNFLRTLQCDAVQGYLFERELTGPQVSELLARHPATTMHAAAQALDL